MALVFKVNSNLSAFTCADAGFSMNDGTTGNAVSASVSAGTISSISPSTYQSGINTYTATITVPSGYSNTGETINCTDTADGSGGGSPSPDPGGGDPPAPDPGGGGYPDPGGGGYPDPGGGGFP